ncbi:MAG: hypothetical protein HYY62_02565, partial [Deltaproteobacteria bacterium]|nr:hypothetical protein [Deltaproteobacteria bacterium]
MKKCWIYYLNGLILIGGISVLSCGDAGKIISKAGKAIRSFTLSLNNNSSLFSIYDALSEDETVPIENLSTLDFSTQNSKVTSLPPYLFEHTTPATYQYDIPKPRLYGHFLQKTDGTFVLFGSNHGQDQDSGHEDTLSEIWELSFNSQEGYTWQHYSLENTPGLTF